MGVNTLVGDKGFFHYFPVPSWFLHIFYFSTHFQNLRVYAHLKYAHEKLTSSTSYGTIEQQFRRNVALQKFQEYFEKRLFPHNYDMLWKRAPCFVDSNGTLCAVAHIINESGDKALVKHIDNKYHNAIIHDMVGDKRLLSWAHLNGFTAEDLALIQPGYPGFAYICSSILCLFMALYMGIAALTLHSPSSGPLHYFFLACGIYNLAGIGVVVGVCMLATFTDRPNFALLWLIYRFLWCLGNIGFLSYYEAEIKSDFHGNKGVMIGGWIIVLLTILITGFCDTCGYVMARELVEMLKEKEKKREAERLANREETTPSVEDSTESVSTSDVSTDQV